jgi:hypothetical protein
VNEKRDRYRKILDEHDVDLVLQGHDHTYARTYPLVYEGIAPENTHSTVYLTPENLKVEIFSVDNELVDEFTLTKNKEQSRWNVPRE